MGSMKTFTKSFTQQEAIPEAAIEQAVRVLRSGRLHRYNAEPGETTETELLEQEFAAYMGVPYCLACASGGYAMHIALRSAGLQPGDKVLSNAFTLAPVPGAIHNAGGVPVLVETNDDYTVELDHLRDVAANSDVRFFLLSHMRGHIGDMDAIVGICEANGIVLIEDCAHTMGARWRGRLSGTFGKVACFSTQTYKHINSGEGGLLVTADPELAARAVLYSGSYMMFERHMAAPSADEIANVRLTTPNYSGRMDNLRAAILRPQLQALDEQCVRWNRLYAAVERWLKSAPGVFVPVRAAHEQFVGSSIQFSLPGYSESEMRRFIERCSKRGIQIKWFGDAEPRGYTSRFDSWQYLDGSDDLPGSRQVLSVLCDLRLPLTFDEADCDVIGEIITDCVGEIRPVKDLAI